MVMFTNRVHQIQSEKKKKDCKVWYCHAMLRYNCWMLSKSVGQWGRSPRRRRNNLFLTLSGVSFVKRPLRSAWFFCNLFWFVLFFKLNNPSHLILNRFSSSGRSVKRGTILTILVNNVFELASTLLDSVQVVCFYFNFVLHVFDYRLEHACRNICFKTCFP